MAGKPGPHPAAGDHGRSESHFLYGFVSHDAVPQGIFRIWEILQRLRRQDPYRRVLYGLFLIGYFPGAASIASFHAERTGKLYDLLPAVNIPGVRGALYLAQSGGDEYH